MFTSATSAVTAVVTVKILAQTGHSAFLYRDGWWVAAFVIGVVATTAFQVLESVWVAERQGIWFLGSSTAFAVVKLALVVLPVFAAFGAVGILWVGRRFWRQPPWAACWCWSADTVTGRAWPACPGKSGRCGKASPATM